MEQLHLAGVLVVVLDDHPDPRLVRTVQAWGIRHVTGNARLGDVLLRCGLNGAAAVICVESEELVSLEIALLVHELRPTVRVVVQLANAAVGQAVADVTGRGSVLYVAELAAPSVVDACLNRTAHRLSLDGELFVVASTRSRAVTTLRQQFGELAPVAVVSAHDGSVCACPGRDREVAVGDTVHLLGTPEQFDAAQLPWRDASATAPARSWRSPVHRLRATLLSVLSEADRGMRMTVAALLAVVVISMTY